MALWLRRALVALGGGAIAFVVVVLLNRVLVGLGLNVQKHPEVGPVSLTVAALVVGSCGAVVGLASASGRKRDKLAEFSAATLGSLFVVYVILAAGAIAGAFKHVHFHSGRLVSLGVPILLVFGREALRWFRNARSADTETT